MKFRQKIAFGLCLFYIVSVIGIAVSLHFCGGKLSSMHFTQTAKCGACKEDVKAEKHNCCKNTEVQSKVDDSHEAGFKVKLPKDFSIDLFLVPFIADLFKSVLPRLFAKSSEAPPISARLSLNTLNCVFRN